MIFKILILLLCLQEWYWISAEFVYGSNRECSDMQLKVNPF
jgi:hypothetical protein